MIPLGFGMGLALGAITDLVVLASPPERTGATVALNTVIRMAAAALGAQVAIAIVTSTHGQIPGLPAARGFTDAFVIAAIATGITIAALALTPARTADPADSHQGIAATARDTPPQSSRLNRTHRPRKARTAGHGPSEVWPGGICFFSARWDSFDRSCLVALPRRLGSPVRGDRRRRPLGWLARELTLWSAR